MGREGTFEVAAEAGPPSMPNPQAQTLFEHARNRLLQQSRIPLSTYRVQFNKSFRFKDAEALVPYLDRLGISDLYASPIQTASPGSTHGYDVIDHQTVNAEVGTPEELAQLSDALRARGMGQVLDTVPNHMGIERGNALWFDVLENGPSSMYAKFFDVDWDPVKGELKDKVLLPILGDQYGVVLENGELKLEYRDGAFFVAYWDHRWPLAPRQYATVLRLRLGELEEQLGAKDECFIELMSIITAIEHLPARTETDRPRVLERNREKEVIKRRLAAVVERKAEIAAFIERNLRELNGVKGEPRTFDALDRILQQCSYRLAHWRVAGEEINYRRFFDINSLAAIRVEDPDVFEEAHALTMKWLGEGRITGLRIDHPDGLFDPTAYFLKLQERAFIEIARTLHGDEKSWADVEPQLLAHYRAELDGNPDSPLRKPVYVVVEKIQGGRERIPDAWAVHGTTGYRFANAITGLFVDRSAEDHLTETYARFIGHATDFEELLYQKKRLILSISMASEINVLARELNRISEMNRRSRDFTLNALRRALIEFIAHFPVYRTYVDAWRPELDKRDIQYVEWTIARAKRHDRATSATIFDFLKSILLRQYPEHLNEQERAVMLRFAMKLQQLTGPVMAKGLEDTVFYIYHRLTSLNEVGGEPERFGLPLHTFHLRNQERAEKWPGAMLTSSTHDTKRSEDVRARINVISEVQDEWRKKLRKWAALNEPHKTIVHERLAPSLNDEYLFYQTVVGAWPMGEKVPAEEMASFRTRIRDYMLKAIKEAKVQTSWVNSNSDYEGAVAAFVDAALDPVKGKAFLSDISRFKRRIEPTGQVNALGQVLLKLASPGVADTYQGTELWDLSLVDPDNRRPVDFALRDRLLRELDEAAQADPVALAKSLAANMDDGRIKLHVLSRALRLRKALPQLFARGDYAPLDALGDHADRLVAFLRRAERAALICVVPRLVHAMVGSRGGIAGAFSDTWIGLPEGDEGPWRCAFTGETFTPTMRDGAPALNVGRILHIYPVALLSRNDE